MDSIQELDIIIIGAGLSGLSSLIITSSLTRCSHVMLPGIAALSRVCNELPHASVAVFEKVDRMGGTWAKNTGLSCDIPSQVRNQRRLGCPRPCSRRSSKAKPTDKVMGSSTRIPFLSTQSGQTRTPRSPRFSLTLRA